MPIESAKIGRDSSIKHEKNLFTKYLQNGKGSKIDSDDHLDDSWILITYDVSDNNSRRNWIREKIKNMGGLWKNDSTYLIPSSVQTEEALLEWGKFHDVNLFVVGMKITTTEAIQTLTQAYIGKLLADLKEIRDSVSKGWSTLKIIEENLDLKEEDLKEKYNVTFRGFHNIVSSVENRYEDLRKMINDYGNDNDEFETELLYSFIGKMKNRFEHVRELKGIGQ